MKKTLAGLILLYLCAYLLPLGGRPLVVPDEMRYGEMAREMILTGDWTVPRLMGLRYFEKPILGHWLNADAMLLFGDNRFGVRFASAAAVGLAALGVYLLVRRQRDAKTALLAAFILLTCAEVQLVGTYSALDSMVSAFITLSICCFLPATTTGGRARMGWLALTGFFAGGAFLVKGFLAIALPVMVIAAFLMLQRRWRDLWTMPWIPLLVLLAVALPWSVAIALREGDFWRYFFFEEHVHRFFAKGEAQHAAPFWYFVPVLLAGALPWTLVAPLPLFRTMKERMADPFVRFCGLWFLLPFLFFSASVGKLGTYILPCYPPLAILLAIGLADEAAREKSFRVGAWILFGVFALAFVGIGATALLPVEKLKIYQPWESYKYLVALAGLAVSAGLALASARHVRRPVRLACFGAALALGIAAFQFCLPESGTTSLAMDRFFQRQKAHLPADALVVTDTRAFTAVGFVLGRPDIYLIGGMGELDYGLAYPDAAGRYIGPATEDLLAFFRRHPDRVIVVTGRCNWLDEILPRLPHPVYQDAFRHIGFYVFPPSGEKGPA